MPIFFLNQSNLIYESYNVYLSIWQTGLGRGKVGRADIFSYWPLSSWPLSFISANLKQGRGRGRAGQQLQTGAGQGKAGKGGRGRAGQAKQKDLGNFRIWFSGHGFHDLGSQLWGLGNFRIWFSGHGFQDLGSQLWGLDFHTRGFQDQNLKTFRMWFSGCGISILGPGFHTGGFIVAFGNGHPLVIGNRKQYILAYSFANNNINAQTTKIGTIEHVFS